jgi:hypothetical protein
VDICIPARKNRITPEQSCPETSQKAKKGSQISSKPQAKFLPFPPHKQYTLIERRPITLIRKKESLMSKRNARKIEVPKK